MPRSKDRGPNPVDDTQELESLTTAQARRQLSDLVSRVLYTKRPIVLTRYGRAVAALVPIDSVSGGGDGVRRPRR